MIGTPLNRRVRRVLGVTVDDGLALSLVDTPSVYFPAAVTSPSGDNSTFDGSPRTGLSAWRLTWQIPMPLHACDRIEVPDDDTYELLADPRPVLNGRRTVGFSAPMLPVALLYPRSADLMALGGGAALATVECAIFSARESNGQRGTYHDTYCELPSSVWQLIDPAGNQALHFSDGSSWVMTEAALSPEVPFVTAGIRKAG